MRHFMLTIFFLNLGFGNLFAQDRMSDRVEHNLKQLARKIEQIRVLAERYENEEALKTIQSAREDFDSAISLLDEWKRNRQRLGLLEQARAKCHYLRLMWKLCLATSEYYFCALQT